MRADEAHGLARLAGVTLGGATRRISELHHAVAGRVFRAVGPSARPVEALHDAIATVAYRSTEVGLRGGARLIGSASAGSTNQLTVARSPGGRTALAMLNGAWGDWVERETPALAFAMTLRLRGRDVPCTPSGLAQAFPDAGPRVVVFLHGLTESDQSWAFRSVAQHGRPGVTYGTLLARDLGLSPVFLRYPTGLHISDNGRALDALLGSLVDSWPVPVEDLVLIGHSMGGLVARSALHQAAGGTPAGACWTTLVRDTITLGGPHLGAPLERGVHRLTHRLEKLPETRPIALLLRGRSVGVKDLRRGTLVETDWAGRDLDSLAPATHTHVPLHDGARHSVVLATLAATAHARSAAVLGDLLVPPLSAIGDTGDADRLAYPVDRVRRLGRTHHFALLNHPEVYAQIRDWLAPHAEGEPVAELELEPDLD